MGYKSDNSVVGFLAGLVALIIMLPGLMLIVGLALWPVLQFLKFIY